MSKQERKYSLSYEFLLDLNDNVNRFSNWLSLSSWINSGADQFINKIVYSLKDNAKTKTLLAYTRIHTLINYSQSVQAF